MRYVSANVNAVATDGSTPLHAACGTPYVETVEWLLAHGARVNARDKFGQTPLAQVQVSRMSAESGTRDPSKVTRDAMIEYVRKQDRIIDLLKSKGATE